jgi:hypothetical protein
MGNKNIIELNGKRYDALSGELLGAATIPHTPTPTKVYPKGHTGRTLDVFRRASVKKPTLHQPAVTHIQVLAAKAVPANRPVSAASAPAHHQPAHTPAPHLRARQPQSTQTLIRSAVKKPAPGLKKQIHVQAELTRQVAAVIVPKTAVQSLNPARLQRAQATTRSPKIDRYNHASAPLAARFMPLPVQPTPPQPDVAAPKPQPDNKPITPADMFEHAIASADHFADLTASKLHFKKKARRHVASLAAGSLALLLLGGFLAYRNVPDVQLQVAAFRAGIHSSMPDLQAAGFAFDAAKEQNGKLTIGFHGPAGQYQLTQQKTNWSADDMVQTVASIDASGQPNYTTLAAGDQTIYRFANNSATWIDHGTWYQLNGTGALSDYQITSIAASV